MQVKKNEDLQKIVGHNLKKARLIADMSMQEVMIAVWKVHDNKNRLSEIENGMRMPSPYVLFNLSVLYGVSLDFIFGVSAETERDMTSARAGLVIQTMRSTGMEIMDRIGMELARHMAKMPRLEGQVLLDKSKRAVDVFKKHFHGDLVFKSEYLEFNDAINELDRATKELEKMIARYQRAMELAAFEHINRSDSDLAKNRYVTEGHLSADFDFKPMSTIEV